MPQIVTGHYTQDGSLVYLPIGFIPDWLQWVDYTTAILIHYWFEMMEDDEASGSQEGILDDGDGTYSKNADDGGFTAYDTESAFPTINEWTQARSTAATARSATADGTFIKPTTSSITDREAVFECVTAGTGGDTEPTWPDNIGGQVTDSSTVWERVNQPTKRQGYKGVCVSGTIQTNGQEAYFLALQADDAKDWGDVDGWASGVYNG